MFAALVAGKQRRTFLVVLAPVVQIPAELEKLFVVLEHALPGRDQLERIARELLCDDAESMPQGIELSRILEAAAGLTHYEAEGAFSLSIARHNRIRPESVWELKAQALRKNNLLTLHRSGSPSASRRSISATVMNGGFSSVLVSRTPRLGNRPSVIFIGPPQFQAARKVASSLRIITALIFA